VAHLILINAYPGIGLRAAVLEAGRLIAYEWESADRPPQLGQIHRGKVAHDAGGMDAVDVELAGDLHGLLHRSDTLAVATAPEGLVPFPPTRDLCRPAKRRPGPGTPVIVQVKREGHGAKAPQLTTDISFPGRRLVLRPYRPIRRISREITQKAARDALHQTLKTLRLPNRAGVILRTAGVSAGRAELAAEFEALVDRWKQLVAQARDAPAPCLLYREPDLGERLLRDDSGEGRAEVVVDDPALRTRLRRLADDLWGAGVCRIKLHRGSRPVFHAYQVENQVANLYNRELRLPGGGSLVIEHTEALVAVDVNAGRGLGDAEATAIAANLEAADELFRQVRLRDIGGLVVIDFIAMQKAENREQLTERLRSLAREDRRNVWLEPVSKLGFAAFTRRAQKPVANRLGLEPCAACHGGSWIPGDRVAAADFLDALGLRSAEGKTTAHVSPRLLSILSGSEAFKKAKKRFGRKLAVKELPEGGSERFEIR
jgi:ribonuclease E